MNAISFDKDILDWFRKWASSNHYVWIRPDGTEEYCDLYEHGDIEFQESRSKGRWEINEVKKLTINIGRERYQFIFQDDAENAICDRGSEGYIRLKVKEENISDTGSSSAIGSPMRKPSLV